MTTATQASPKLLRVVEAYRNLRAEFGVPPTAREVGEHLGLSSPATVQAHVNNAIGLGLLKEIRPGTSASRNIVAAD